MSPKRPAPDTVAALPVTARTALHRIPKRGSHERATVHAILDEGLVCHMGFVSDGQPFVIPTTYGRAGETVYIHGAAVARQKRRA